MNQSYRARYYEYRANAIRYEESGEFKFAIDEWRNALKFAPDGERRIEAFQKLVGCAGALQCLEKRGGTS